MQIEKAQNNLEYNSKVEKQYNGSLEEKYILYSKFTNKSSFLIYTHKIKILEIWEK